MCVFVCVFYLGEVGFGHVEGQESDPVETFLISRGGRTVSVVLLVLTHHFTVEALKQTHKEASPIKGEVHFLHKKSGNKAIYDHIHCSTALL